MTDFKDSSRIGTRDMSPIQESEFLPAEEKQEYFLDLRPMEALAQNKTIRVPKNPNFTRKQVVEAFQSAFELIGGVPRLALWAHENPDKFYQLYGKLLPSGNNAALGEQAELKVKLSIEHSPLDQLPDDEVG